MYLKVNDVVAVINGKDKYSKDKKGNKEYKTGKVKKVFPKTNKVIVEGVNIVKKHQKPTQQNSTGSIVEMEAPIDASNVMLYDPKVKKPTRISIVEKEVNGKIVKVRVSKKSDYEFN